MSIYMELEEFIRKYGPSCNGDACDNSPECDTLHVYTRAALAELAALREQVETAARITERAALLDAVVAALPVCSRLDLKGKCKQTALYTDVDGYFVCRKHRDPEDGERLRYADALERLRKHGRDAKKAGAK